MTHYPFTCSLYLKGASAPFYAFDGWISDLRRAKSFLRKRCELHGCPVGCLIVHGKWTLHFCEGEFTKEFDQEGV